MPQVVVAILASCCIWIRAHCSNYIVSLLRSDRNPRKRNDQSLPNRESRLGHLERHCQLQLRHLPRRMRPFPYHPLRHYHPPPRGTEPGCPPVLIVVRCRTHDTTGATTPPPPSSPPPPPPPKSTPPPPPINHLFEGPILKEHKQTKFYKSFLFLILLFLG